MPKNNKSYLCHAIQGGYNDWRIESSKRQRNWPEREMQGHGIGLNSKENITCTRSKLTDAGSKLRSYANACRTQDDDDDDDDPWATASRNFFAWSAFQGQP